MSTVEEERAAAYLVSRQAQYEWQKNNFAVTLAGDAAAYSDLVDDWEPLANYLHEIAYGETAEHWLR